METLHKLVFYFTLTWQALLLAVVVYVGIWLFAALDVIIKPL